MRRIEDLLLLPRGDLGVEKDRLHLRVARDSPVRRAAAVLSAEIHQRLGDTAQAAQVFHEAEMLPPDAPWPDPLFQPVIELATGKLTRWTYSEVGGLNPASFVKAERIRFPSFDGREIPGWYYRPRIVKNSSKISDHGIDSIGYWL